MRFEPKPENDFKLFFDTYFSRCRQVCPKLRVIAGKWTFEDLIPGLSDFDTRLIFENDTSVQDWSEMSIAVGEIHTDLASKIPRWARMLEHLPGLDLTLAEITDPVRYYPEFQQWTFYKDDENFIKTITNYLDSKPWAKRDELFFLKKIAIYYGPYMRGIDPAVNMAKWENKYPLHSRFMHYFTPPVQSAVSIVRRRGTRGKFEALRLARDMFPNPDVIDMILDAVERHYEVPEYYEEPRLSEIEKTLENYLRDVYAVLSDHVTLTEVNVNDTPEELKARVAMIPVDPAEAFYEGAKFCRFMKGRLIFYGTDIAWFDAEWLIHNELGRIVSNFYEKPLKTYGLARFKKNLKPEEVLKRIRDNGLPAEVCDGAEVFAGIAAEHIHEGREKEQALKVAEVFEPIQMMIEMLGRDLSNWTDGA